MPGSTSKDCLHIGTLFPQGKTNELFVFLFLPSTKLSLTPPSYFQVAKRDDISITYNTALPVLFGVKHYADALWPVMKKRNITVNLQRNLVEVKPEQNIAIFENLEKPGERFEEKV